MQQFLVTGKTQVYSGVVEINVQGKANRVVVTTSNVLENRATSSVSLLFTMPREPIDVSAH